MREPTAVQLEAAREEFTQLREELRSQVDVARALLGESDGRVGDNATRDTLAAAIAQGDALVAATEGIEPPTRVRVVDDVVEVSYDVEWDPGYTATTAALAAAASDVEESHRSWAYAQLEGSLSAAREVQATSDGQVNDAATRGALAASIERGQAAWDAGLENTDAGDLLSIRDEVDQAGGQVETSRARWAHDQLGQAINDARGVLAGSEGQVTDNAVRDGLFTAINDGQATWDTGTGGVGVADSLAARDRINTDVTNVQTAVAQWQSTQPQG